MRAPTPPGNRYCARLGLDPVPRVEDALARPGIKLFHLVVVALLERGGPMPLEAVVERLAAAVARRDDLRLSVVKAWHGRPPVVREPDGRLALDLSSSESSSELEWVLLETWLARRRPVPAPPPVPPPDPVLPGEEAPLTAEELDAAFRDRGLSNLSSLRQAAAVLDTYGRPMRVEEVEAVLASLTRYRQ